MVAEASNFCVVTMHVLAFITSSEICGWDSMHSNVQLSLVYLSYICTHAQTQKCKHRHTGTVFFKKRRLAGLILKPNSVNAHGTCLVSWLTSCTHMVLMHLEAAVLFMDTSCMTASEESLQSWRLPPWVDTHNFTVMHWLIVCRHDTIEGSVWYMFTAHAQTKL